MQAYRASSLFQPHNLRQAIKDTLASTPEGPKHLFGSLLTFAHTNVARSVALLGFDFVMVDAAHTAMDAENLVRIVQIISMASEGRTCAMVRVPSADSDLLVHALDAGAAGIIFPLIDTADQAAHAVSLCRYPYAGGVRSLSPSALIAGLNDSAPVGTTHEHVADRNIAVIVQIESALAIDNLDAIARVPGIDCLMLGPGDLRISLGLPSKKVGEFEDEKFEVALRRLLEVRERVGVPLMTVAYKVAVRNREWMKRFGVLVTSADLMALVKGMGGELGECRRALGMGEGS